MRHSRRLHLRRRRGAARGGRLGRLGLVLDGLVRRHHALAQRLGPRAQRHAVEEDVLLGRRGRDGRRRGRGCGAARRQVQLAADVQAERLRAAAGVSGSSRVCLLGLAYRPNSHREPQQHPGLVKHHCLIRFKQPRCPTHSVLCNAAL